MRVLALSIIFVIGTVGFLPQVQADPEVSIIMDKTAYSYCEKLFYIIKVSEITGESAIVHISDESGRDSSAIPIPITELENPVPSPFPFEAEIFPLGKYFINVQYSTANTGAEFELIESDSICIPELIKPIMSNWLTGDISDGFLLDAFQRYVDSRLVNVPFEINEGNIHDVRIPEWVKTIGHWWMKDMISDKVFSNAINNLLERNIIGIPKGI